VQENKRLTLAALDVVQSDPIDLDESSLWRVGLFCTPGAPPNYHGGGGQRERYASHAAGAPIIAPAANKVVAN